MKKSDLLSMNTSWLPEDLKLYEGNQSEFVASLIFTFVKLVIFVVGVLVHRAVYKVLTKLPGRAINQMIYPYMVSHRLLYTWTEDWIIFFPDSIPAKSANYVLNIICRYSKDMNFHKIWRV